MRKPRRLPPEELAPFVWEPPVPDRAKWGDRPATADGPPPEPTDWAKLFGNDHPVEVEVGFGKGLFLLNAGATRPDRNFFGIEIVRKYQLLAATRVAVRRLPNVKVCSADAKRVLRDYVRPGSVAAVHVYFPDPWWKTRHHKRRLFTAEFADLTLRVLAPGGQLHFATDVAEYFQHVAGLLAAVHAFRPLPPPAPSGGKTEQDYLTHFERKFRKVGRPIYRALYEKAG